MQYTKYFSVIVKENGSLNLDSYQFRRMMNIVHLEGVINGLNKIKNANKSNGEYYKYDLVIIKEKELLTELTNDLKPDLLVKELLDLSE